MLHLSAECLRRLGTYKYYNMDQVVAQSLVLAKKLLASPVYTTKNGTSLKVEHDGKLDYYE